VRTLLLCATVLAITGCATYSESSFLRPSGPGDTVKVHGVPRMQRLRLGFAGYVDISADKHASRSALNLAFNLNAGHTARLASPAIAIKCRGSSEFAPTIAELRAWRIRDGIGYVATYQSEQQMLGREGLGSDPKQGDRAVGIYWATASFEMCPNEVFDVTLPGLVLDERKFDLGTISFAPDHGHFVYLPAIA